MFLENNEVQRPLQLTASQSVSPSVRPSWGRAPPELINRFWLQSRQLRFYHGASSLCRGQVCHVTCHSPRLCQAIYTYVHFDLFVFNAFFAFYIQNVCVHARPLSPGFVQQIMPDAYKLPSLHYRVQNGSGAYPASNPMGNRSSFPGGKATRA